MGKNTFDPLTGAYTRALLQQRLEEEISRTEREKTAFSLILLDLDYFKSVNDAFGHDVGDAVLKACVVRIRQVIRRSDSIFRYGGDEFLLLLPHTNTMQVHVLSTRLQHVFRDQPLPTNPPISLTISGGTATYPIDGNTIETLFRVADQRHYTAKHQGRARIISKSESPPTHFSLKDPERIIGQEQAIAASQQFTKQLKKQQRAVLYVQAERGTGVPIFFRHLARLARLQGYLVLHIQGDAAHNKRVLGALHEAKVEGISRFIEQWEEIELPQTWSNLVKEKQAAGWLVLVENWDTLDDVSQALLRRLFFSADIPSFGLVYHLSAPPLWKQDFPFDITSRLDTSLSPFTRGQTQVWVQQILKWNPPDPLVDWLQKQTGGHMEYILPVLQALQNAGLLTALESHQWQINEAYKTFDVSPYTHPPKPKGNIYPLEGNLIGRGQDLRFLKEAVVEHRLVSIIGPGGTGKTRLARQVAAESMTNFPDGVFFIPLEDIRRSHQIPQRVAETLQLTLTTQHPTDMAVCEALKDRRMLLVLDNFEQLAANDDFISNFLQQTRGPHLLVTTRTPLELYEESHHLLRGLKVPEHHHEETADFFEHIPAVRLFLDSARRYGANISLTAQNRAYIAEICRMTDGLPLGLNLAASWTHLFSLQELVERIHQGSGMLSEGPYTQLPKRQRSISVIFDTFWDSLVTSEQEMLMGLSIFPQAFSAKMAREICQVSTLFLDALMQRAILSRDSHAFYRFHPLLRQYLDNHLSSHPDIKQRVQHQFIKTLSTWCAERIPVWEYISSPDVHLEIQNELPNLHLAWDLGIKRGQYQYLQPILNSLHHYYQHYGWFHAGIRLAETLLDALEATSTSCPVLFGYAQLTLSTYAYHLGDYPRGLYLARQAFRKIRKHGNLLDQFYASHTLSQQYSAIGQLNKSRLLRSWQAQHVSKIQQPALLAKTYSAIALDAYQEGDLNTAEEYWQQTLNIDKKQQHTGRIAATLNNLGNVAYERGNYEGAREYLEQALTLAKHLEGQTLLASIYDSLGKVSIAQGEVQQASKMLLCGLRICRRVDAIPLGLEILCNMGHLQAANGRLNLAARIWHAVLANPRAVHSVKQMAKSALESYNLPYPSEQPYPNLDFSACLEILQKEGIISDADLNKVSFQSTD